MKRALAASFLLAATVAHAAAPRDELVVAEWISTGAQAEHMVLPRIRSAIDYLKVDPAGQTKTSAIRIMGERLVTTQTTMHSISDRLPSSWPPPSASSAARNASALPRGPTGRIERMVPALIDPG